MFKGRHFDRSVILLCVRRYLAYNLSLRNLEEMMADRGISVDHATIHRWVVRYAPELLQRFNLRKRGVTGDGTWTKPISKSVGGGCIFTAPSTVMAIPSNSGSAIGVTSLQPNASWARRSSGMAGPSASSLMAVRRILSCDTVDRLQDRARRDLKPIRIRQSAYLNNRIEQDQRAIKRRVRPMLGFKSGPSARVILGGIEMVHMMRKQQAKYADRVPRRGVRAPVLG